ncbi:MAG: phosphoenolpyruvate synthase regulatory protein [Planctomycetes bacterium]|nr:phosphoenolpyruvate synthase regulatory protein [Planctomycetota bacterium]
MEEKSIRIQGSTREYTIFVASDATGLTAERVVQAALAQFEPHVAGIVRFSHVNSEDEVRHIVARAARERGIIVHTLVLPELRGTLHEEGRHYQVDTIDLMGPLLKRLSTKFNVAPTAQPGLFRQLDEEYYRRIEAVDYTVKHDDGLRPEDLAIADIVIVGVSRTCKTPLSIFLAYRGWRVANVPIVVGIDAPKELADVSRERVVALTMDPDQLVKVRTARLRRLGHVVGRGYNDHERIHKELLEAKRLYVRNRWPIVNVTNKSVEETATEVIAMVRRSAKAAK